MKFTQCRGSSKVLCPISAPKQSVSRNKIVHKYPAAWEGKLPSSRETNLLYTGHFGSCFYIYFITATPLTSVGLPWCHRVKNLALFLKSFTTCCNRKKVYLTFPQQLCCGAVFGNIHSKMKFFQDSHVPASVPFLASIAFTVYIKNVVLL